MIILYKQTKSISNSFYQGNVLAVARVWFRVEDAGKEGQFAGHHCATGVPVGGDHRDLPDHVAAGVFQEVQEHLQVKTQL